ncbi:LysR substrate-binding domain-containing protein [Halomonas sp. ATCHA]|uniref:LysR substrate-binding domain-containing protein n=2 Tax=Halomonas llamarensis TaxID=2945104 RepID=A0ABT0SU18_9GAMM|nr:LysR substrate-binding domain-containing protein [Halomonas llamarensis]MCL7931334.1 LysR substrate-binding domain-containing protein [Halomonas llamarensis]
MLVVVPLHETDHPLLRCRQIGIAIGRVSAYTSASYENIRAAVSAGLGIGVLPASALAEDHIILGNKEGFPSLPMVELVMVQASQKRATKQLADFLALSSGMKSPVVSEEC